MKKTVLWLPFCGMLLTACTAPMPQVKLIKPEVPQSLLTCADAPSQPTPDATQRDVASWAARLWYTHGDCKSKLKAASEAVR